MNIEESIKRFGLVPSDADLPAIRELLAQESELERRGGQREPDFALLCCVQLFSRGQLEDVLRIWDAKQSGFDLGCHLDVQLLCGAGLEQTELFLAGDTSKAADDALTHLTECVAHGDFVGFSPARYMDQQRRYFV